MKIKPGFSKNGVKLKAGSWYLAKRDRDPELWAWHCQYAFNSDRCPKLLRSPSRLSWDAESKKLDRHSPSPYSYDCDFYVERELTESEVAEMYKVSGYENTPT